MPPIWVLLSGCHGVYVCKTVYLYCCSRSWVTHNRMDAWLVWVSVSLVSIKTSSQEPLKLWSHKSKIIQVIKKIYLDETSDIWSERGLKPILGKRTQNVNVIFIPTRCPSFSSSYSSSSPSSPSPLSSLSSKLFLIRTAIVNRSSVVLLDCWKLADLAGVYGGTEKDTRVAFHDERPGQDLLLRGKLVFVHSYIHKHTHTHTHADALWGKKKTALVIIKLKCNLVI